MKKIILIALASVFSLASFATIDVNIDDAYLPSGGTTTLVISISGDEVRNSFQTWIVLPAGITVAQADVKAGPIYDSPTISVGNNEGYCKIGCICASPYKSTEGALLYVTLHDDGTTNAVGDELTLSFSNFELADATNPYVYPANTTAKVTITNQVIVDEEKTFVPYVASGQSVKLIRTFENGKFYTLCVPFTISSLKAKNFFGGTKPTIYQFSGVTTDFDDTTYEISALNFNFTEASGITANVPYIIKANADVTNPEMTGAALTTEGTNVVAFSDDVLSASVKFIGTYAPNTVVPEHSFYLKDNKFYSSKGGTKMKGTRAYIDLTAFYTAADNEGVDVLTKEFTFNIDGLETSINQIDQDLKAEGWYDLNGRKLSVKPATKGVYINNGKKVVVK